MLIISIHKMSIKQSIKPIAVLFLVAIFIFLGTSTLAAESYSPADVAEHDTTTDCWMSFENKVYDFSNYLKSHDLYLDIQDWCGLDMTEDFKTKAGLDRDHMPRSYSPYLEALYFMLLATSFPDQNLEKNMNGFPEKDSTFSGIQSCFLVLSRHSALEFS